MRVDRRFLCAGVFLMAIGGVIVAADLRALDAATLTDTLRVWPLAIIAIGLSVVLRKTRWSLAGLIVAAALPGIVLGSAFAVAPRFAGDCGARGDPASVATEEGTFNGPASVSVRTGCGSMRVSTGSADRWHLTAGNTAGRTPIVQASARSLSIASVGGEDWSFLDGGRDTWDVTLPTGDIEALSLVANGSHSQVGLSGARIGRLAITANASQVVVDASTASIADLSGAVNVGSLSIQLPADSDLVGSLRIGGSELRICTPPGVGLRVTTKGWPRTVLVDGLQQTGSDWQSADYASAPRRADLSVHSNFGSVHINPPGGCT